MGRSRACHYYRQVNVFNDSGSQTSWTKVTIVRFDWETAQQMANSEPKRLTATKL